LKEEERQLVEQLSQSSPEIARAQQLVLSFSEMVKGRQVEKLRGWLKEAFKSGVAEFVSFANGISKDFEAVQAALSFEWSNGQVEGQVNRLKLIKRQMYGRAKFDLLKARVLHRG
jgi:transposase